MSGFILWEGASQLDGAPIVVVATRVNDASHNDKTGAQVQTYIMPAGVRFAEARASGADASVCGDCGHRPILARETGAPPCYVFRGPADVWDAYQRGAYPRLTPAEAADALVGLNVRLGTWGDPAAVPFDVWWQALAGAGAHTGYTHQWRTCDPRFALLCMASTDTLAEKAEAEAMGWRTFTVLPVGAPDPAGAVHCPASAEMGKLTDCDHCQACGGWSAKARAPVVIWAHDTSSAAKRKRLNLTHRKAA